MPHTSTQCATYIDKRMEYETITWSFSLMLADNFGLQVASFLVVLVKVVCCEVFYVVSPPPRIFSIGSLSYLDLKISGWCWASPWPTRSHLPRQTRRINLDIKGLVPVFRIALLRSGLQPWPRWTAICWGDSWPPCLFLAPPLLSSGTLNSAGPWRAINIWQSL